MLAVIAYRSRVPFGCIGCHWWSGGFGGLLVLFSTGALGEVVCLMRWMRCSRRRKGFGFELCWSAWVFLEDAFMASWARSRSSICHHSSSGLCPSGSSSSRSLILMSLLGTSPAGFISGGSRLCCGEPAAIGLLWCGLLIRHGGLIFWVAMMISHWGNQEHKSISFSKSPYNERCSLWVQLLNASHVHPDGREEQTGMP